MKTLIKIAWRNVWRNKIRSLTVISSIVLGLWSGFFTMSLTIGLNEQRMDSAVKSYLSHVQIHHPNFLENYNIKDVISKPDNIYSSIEKNNLVKASSRRTIIAGMGSTAHGSLGLQVIGIDPEHEKEITSISNSIVKGTYFSKVKSKPVVIGEVLAEKLKLDVKKKLYITFVDENGDQQKIKLKVEGIYKTASSIFDQTNVFMRRSDLASEIGNSGLIHEVSILCHSIEHANQLKQEISAEYPNEKTETWDEIAPELGYADEMMSTFIYIFMGIILIALSFGVINTMLMAVLERKRELGMLMSVGMNKTKVFLMILFETVFISCIATPIGITLSYLIITYFGEHGIDLSVVGKGLENFGIGARVYTFLPADLYLNISVLTLLIAFISSLLPARRALKLNPAEAVRAL
ncbi:MAG: FtsX-like permease family protein [Flavobacteriales bacterium]|nr:FtsX-like permease family protein [Flavobacteriales bacterium]